MCVQDWINIIQWALAVAGGFLLGIAAAIAACLRESPESHDTQHLNKRMDDYYFRGGREKGDR